MPRLEAVVRGRAVAVEVVVVDSPQGCRGEPAVLFSVHVLEGDGRLEHLAVGVEDELQMGVDLGDAEEAPTVLGVEQVCEDG